MSVARLSSGDCLTVLPTASGARVACGGFGFGLHAATIFDFAPASQEVPKPLSFLVLKSRPLRIVVWHTNTKSRLIGRQVWVGLDLVRVHFREAGALFPLSMFSGICGVKFSTNLVFDYEWVVLPKGKS